MNEKLVTIVYTVMFTLLIETALVFIWVSSTLLKESTMGHVTVPIAQEPVSEKMIFADLEIAEIARRAGAHLRDTLALHKKSCKKDPSDNDCLYSGIFLLGEKIEASKKPDIVMPVRRLNKKT